MNDLYKQTNEFYDQLEAYITSDNNRKAIEEYEIIIGELTELSNKLENHINTRVCLCDLPDSSSLPLITDEEQDQYHKMYSTLEKVAELWPEFDYQIRQKDVLENFNATLTQFIEISSNTNQVVWGSWITSLKQVFEVPDSMLKAQFIAPHLKDNATMYQQKLKDFEFLSSALPSSLEIINKLSDTSESLGQLRGEMVFDFPIEVEEFFTLISSREKGNFVPLSMLTPEIIKWLEHNGEIDNYVVQRKGTKAW